MTPLRGRTLFLASLFLLSAAASAVLRPRYDALSKAPDIASSMPASFGDWREVKLSDAVLPAEAELGPGEAVAYRAYRDGLGRVVTVVFAYGPPLGDSVRLHRPETCYVAQGFEIARTSEGETSFAGHALPIIELETIGSSRNEAVSYILREGSEFAGNFAGKIDGARNLTAAVKSDGALLRVSSIYGRSPDFEINSAFLAAFLPALGDEGRLIILGEAPE